VKFFQVHPLAFPRHNKIPTRSNRLTPT
jgi:hypothetical protein